MQHLVQSTPARQGRNRYASIYNRLEYSIAFKLYIDKSSKIFRVFIFYCFIELRSERNF